MRLALAVAGGVVSLLGIRPGSSLVVLSVGQPPPQYILAVGGCYRHRSTYAGSATSSITCCSRAAQIAPRAARRFSGSQRARTLLCTRTHNFVHPYSQVHTALVITVVGVYQPARVGLHPPRGLHTTFIHTYCVHLCLHTVRHSAGPGVPGLGPSWHHYLSSYLLR